MDRVRICPMAIKCPLFNIYPISKLQDLKHAYCTADYETCHRLAIKRSGQEVPLRLLPDGSTYVEGEADSTTVVTVW